MEEQTNELQKLGRKALKLFIKRIKEKEPTITDSEIAQFSKYKDIEVYFSDSTLDTKEFASIKYLGIEYNPYTNKFFAGEISLSQKTALGVDILSWLNAVIEILKDPVNESGVENKLQDFLFSPGDIVTRYEEVKVEVNKYSDEEVLSWKTKALLLDKILGGNRSINFQKEDA